MKIKPSCGSDRTSPKRASDRFPAVSREVLSKLKLIGIPTSVVWLKPGRFPERYVHRNVVRGFCAAAVVLWLVCAAMDFSLLCRPVTASARSTPESGSKPAAESVTWSHNIAPLLYHNCTGCHHPGGAGPFSLMTYEDARRRAPQMLVVTQSRFMPPWLPEPGYGDFADVRRLREEDLALIKRWVAEGMKQGNPASAPKSPEYNASWTLGKPDLVLTAERPYTLAAGGSDVYRNFILPNPLKETHYIRAIEILPGAPSVVHHANVLIDRTAEFRREHPAEWRDGVAGMELAVDAGETFNPDGHFLFWKQDTPGVVEPVGMPWTLEAGNDLILNMHLKPSGRQETIQARIGLYFTTTPPAQQPMLLQLDRDDALDIPAGEAHFTVEDELTLPVDVEVLGIYPHAHYLGKDMQCWAVLPGVGKQWLIWIRDWDIDRQSVYSYREPVHLPRGTVVHMRYTYDNSAQNPRNPHSPPVRVRAGNRSGDEMSHLWLQVLPVQSAVGSLYPEANAKLDPRLLLEESWMRNRLRKTPGDRISLYNLGAALAGESRYKEAAAVFEEALRGDPKDGRAWNALGFATESAGDWQKARTTYTKAASLAPSATERGKCDARFNLGRLDLAHDLAAEAEAAFRGVLANCPEDAAAHSGLGAALITQNQDDAARSEFERALALDPANLDALDHLGTLAIESGDLDQAVQWLESAVRQSPSSVESREHLALAYVQSGRGKDAVTQLREATNLDPGDSALHALLAQTLAAAGEMEEAIVEQKTALQLKDTDADGWNNLGVFEKSAGHMDAARQDFQHALRIAPGHAKAQTNLARLPNAP